MNKKQYDVAIIGGGPGGYVAAIRASQLGLAVVLIEDQHLGGICLNWGCIPTKALLHTAHVYETTKHGEPYGVFAENVSFSLDKMIAYSRKISTQLSNGVSYLLKKNKVDVISGYGILSKDGDKTQIEVKLPGGDKQEIHSKYIILATGAKARHIPNLDMAHKAIWTYRQALEPDLFPKKLTVIGSGAIGMEFAQFFHSLGSDVTIVEMQDRILPAEDHEISKEALKFFSKKGMNIKTSARVTEFDFGKDNVTIGIEGDAQKVETLSCDRVLVAIGVLPNVENIGLDLCNVALENGFIQTGDYGQTTAQNIFAIGDVAGAPCLAHKASHEGVISAEYIAHLEGLLKEAPHRLEKEKIPACTYTSPQIASIGLNEQKAKELGLNVKIGRFPFRGNGKALAIGAGDGFIKAIFDGSTGEVLGAHMIGTEVTELISNFSIAMSGELTEKDLMETIFPHPTLSEMLHETVLEAFDQVIHI